MADETILPEKEDEDAGKADGGSVQDDARENHLRILFGLTKAVGSGRMGVDAELALEGCQVIEFELKSTTGTSFSTSRDVGRVHFAKWRRMHWLFGFFDADGKNLLRCLYASPALILPWIEFKERYIAPDWELARLATKLDLMALQPALTDILGTKPGYDLADAMQIHKKQYSRDEYQSRMDRPDGYSPERMLEILRDRLVYLIDRGATLNNPKINDVYYQHFIELDITPPEAARADLLAKVETAISAG